MKIERREGVQEKAQEEEYRGYWRKHRRKYRST